MFWVGDCWFGLGLAEWTRSAEHEAAEFLLSVAFALAFLANQGSNFADAQIFDVLFPRKDMGGLFSA